MAKAELKDLLASSPFVLRDGQASWVRFCLDRERRTRKLDDSDAPAVDENLAGASLANRLGSGLPGHGVL